MNTFLLSVWRINTQLVAQKWNMAPLLLRLFTTREVKLKPLALLSRRYLPNATESGANSPVTGRVHRRSVHYISLDKRGRRTVGMGMGGGVRSGTIYRELSATVLHSLSRLYRRCLSASVACRSLGVGLFK